MLTWHLGAVVMFATTGLIHTQSATQDAYAMESYKEEWSYNLRNTLPWLIPLNTGQRLSHTDINTHLVPTCLPQTPVTTRPISRLTHPYSCTNYDTAHKLRHIPYLCKHLVDEENGTPPVYTLSKTLENYAIGMQLKQIICIPIRSMKHSDYTSKGSGE